jgi:hypothetical protein
MFEFIYYYITKGASCFTKCFSSKNEKKGLLEDPEDVEIHELYMQPDLHL